MMYLNSMVEAIISHDISKSFIPRKMIFLQPEMIFA